MINFTVPVIIRKIEKADLDLLVAYRMEYLTELQGERSADYKTALQKELAVFFEKEMREGRFLALVAEMGGKPVSFGAMVIRQIPGDFNQSSYLEADILNMFTVKDARRKGISSQILEQLIGEAKKIGISKLVLHTSKDGEILYRKFGFNNPAYPVLERIL